jgi:hypothetical protein
MPQFQMPPQVTKAHLQEVVQKHLSQTTAQRGDTNTSPVQAPWQTGKVTCK